MDIFSTIDGKGGILIIYREVLDVIWATVGNVWVSSRNREPRHHGVGTVVRVVEVKETVIEVIGMEGHPQKTSFVSSRSSPADDGVNVQKRCGQQISTGHVIDANNSSLLNNEQTLKIASRRSDQDRSRNSAGNSASRQRSGPRLSKSR